VAQSESILIIDDEEVLRDGCQQALSERGYVTATAENGDRGLQLIRELNPDLVLIDLKMPGKSGLEVLQEIQSTHPNIVKIVITGYSTVASAVEAMQKGADDFIAKPFTDDEIGLTVEKGLKKRRLILEREALMREQELIRRNMISLVSHEMRAPLAASIQYLEVILGGMGGEVSQEANEMIRRCVVRLREMLELFSRWLKLATYDPQRSAERFTEVQLSEVAAKVLEMRKPEAQQMKIHLSLEALKDLPPVMGSKGALEEVLDNLVGNAVKYNKEGGWVRVRLFEQNQEILVEVADNGVGIPQEHLPRIFDEFYRVDGRRNAPIKGAGLGLAIVKKLVETHGGSIAAESRFGEGSLFKISLPKPKQTQAESTGGGKAA
jgi:signal transduction histidine kinase